MALTEPQSVTTQPYHLQQLECDTTTESKAPPPPDRETLFVTACRRLILDNPRSHTLSCTYSNEILQDLQGGAYGDTLALKSLKNLTCTTMDGLVPKWSPPSVTHLKSGGVFGSRFNPFSSDSGGHPGIKTAVVHEALESWEVAYIESCAHFKCLLAQIPNLKTLSINNFIFDGSVSQFVPANPFEEKIIWPASRITVLKYRQSRGAYSSASKFDGFFASFPLLVEYHDDMWFSSTATQLVQHCPLLEVVRMRATVSVLLTGLPKLRVLDVPYESVTAENILRRPWVCLDMEEFRCQIAEVPFLTKEHELLVQDIFKRETAGTMGSVQQQHIRTDEEERLMEYSEKCVSTRRQIIGQLSKLTSLKYLSLSPDFKTGNKIFENRFIALPVFKSERDGRNYIRYNDVLPDTLHFRLDSGLDQLASLENLEYLSFESIDHRMETAEIIWLARHFPRLKEMRGLVTENHIGMEPDPENDALVALIRNIRPYIAQR
ncbi:hypothetical protein BGZ96_004044 [Linnemannia gamsii]|uniref:F-box domain-containing protein n=1 Tax=Linnemannia gamsii TaxID=64522 RepID=A0ABQ7K7L4_9FUNG|nr:hypothetical protein BGZ96_004044 [Linnemannia gamsii]